MEYSEKYLHLGEKLDPESHVFCTYKVKTDMPMKEAAAAIATEQSTGTWTAISTLKEENFARRSGKVVDIKGNVCVIAFPTEDFSIDIGGVPQILSVVAGNLFGLDVLSGVRLEDVVYPDEILRQFKGPKFGIDGLRKVLKRPEKPLVGTIVKPKIGLSPRETADYVYEAGMGGLTNGKDDETLVNQKFCPLDDRVVAIAEALDRVKKDSGHVMIHAINISTRGDKILEVAERAQELGASQLMVDVITCGFAAVQVLAEDPSIKLPIHVHRTMHAAITRNKDHGISMKVFAELARMCGADALHIGTFGVGKMTSDSKADLEIQHVCVGPEMPYKRVMPVASGGVQPAMVPKIIAIAGNDVQIQAGGGVSGHPRGVRGGAKAMAQAVEAGYLGITAEQYAKDHLELREALEKVGVGMKLKAKFVDLDTGEITALLHIDDAQDMALREQDRVRIIHEGKTVIAIVSTSDTVIDRGDVGLLGRAFKFIGPEPGELIDVIPATRPESVDYIKKKMDGAELSTDEINVIVKDIATRTLSNIELSAYVTSLHINGMNIRETADLTKAMVNTGETITFDKGPIFDFHSIGGCPGNKVTLLIVPIVAAGGLLIPKTSSRAISSAAGTSDIVEVFANVDFDSASLKRITQEVGGIMAWGGSLNLAPADDVIIKAEYPLGIDPHAQLLASVMSKKKAVGADYLLMDIPMGEGTKVKTMDEAKAYARDFIDLGEKLGMKVECAITYGGQPVGRAIGPALEAIEAISVLEGAKAPTSVIEKTVNLAGMIFEMAGAYNGEEKAKDLLSSGKALKKFQEIVGAQGGNPDIKSTDIKVGEHSVDVLAKKSGYVSRIKNREMVRVARAAGSPRDKGAGVVLSKKVGSKVDAGETLITIYADNEQKMQDALSVAVKLEPVIIEGMVLAKIPSFVRTIR